MENKFLLLLVPIIISLVIICYLILNELIRDYWGKPKLRLDENGYLMFYYNYFNKWVYFPHWDDVESERTVHVHDTTKNISYDLKYVGEGRSVIKIETSDPLNMTSKEIHERFKFYRNANQLWKEYCENINRENDILKNKLYVAN